MDDAPATALETAAARLGIAHAADFYNRYPGETVTLHSRVDVLAPVPGFRLQVSLSGGFTPGDALCASNGQVPRVATAGGVNYFIWDIEEAGGLAAGRRFEFTLQALVAPAERDTRLDSRAVILPLNAAEADAQSPGETVEIAVAAKGRYLTYLPAFYEEDELMGRFLMLFESFWAPINGQIDQLSYYLDPKFAPAAMLPWLATWIGLNLDERWPEDRRRRMLGSAVTLFRQRGTKRGLQDYLEVFTGQKPVIIEHGANNFRMGRDARLGPSIALGTSNRPHTFQVALSLPAITGAPTETERQRLEEQRRRMIVAIIDSEKPAHTDYTLHLKVGELSEG